VSILFLVAFLLLAYLFLIFLAIPFTWFKAYLNSEETKAEKAREAFREKTKESSRNGMSTDWITPYKYSGKLGGIRRISENEIFRVSLDWLMTWGVFWVLEGVWAYSLFKGYESIVQQFDDL